MNVNIPRKLKIGLVQSVASNSITMSPHPKIWGIYRCYAEILNAMQSSMHGMYIIKLIKNMEEENSYFALDNLLVLYHSLSQSLKIKMNIIQEDDVSWSELKYQLSNELFDLIRNIKVRIDLLHPSHLLKTLNLHLDKQAIYDLNVRIYEKPHTQLSLETLASLLNCSRNQINYRQTQIDRAYHAKCTELGQKCFALNFPKFNTKMFWEI